MPNATPPPILLTLFSRSGCHLCELMVREIALAAEGMETRLVHVDIDLQREWLCYSEEIPVLHINGRKAFKIRAEAESIRRRLEQERKRSRE